MRFERTAFGVGVQRSIQLSYGYVLCGNLSYCTAETGRMSIEIYFFRVYSQGAGGREEPWRTERGDSLLWYWLLICMCGNFLYYFDIHKDCKENFTMLSPE